MVEVISNKVVKTRKPHRCCICERKFDPGTKMESQTYKYDEITTSYCCETCKKLIDEKLIPPDDDEGFGMYTRESLEWGMENNKFKGTPEEYLEFMMAHKKNKLEKLQDDQYF